MALKYQIFAIIALTGSSVTALSVGETGTGSVGPHQYESDCEIPQAGMNPGSGCGIPSMYIQSDGFDTDPLGQSYPCSGIATTNLGFSCGDCVQLHYGGYSTTVRTVDLGTGASNFEISFTNYQHLVPEAVSVAPNPPRSGGGSAGPISGVTWTVVDSSMCHTTWNGACHPATGNTQIAPWQCG